MEHYLDYQYHGDEVDELTATISELSPEAAKAMRGEQVYWYNMLAEVSQLSTRLHGRQIHVIVRSSLGAQKYVFLSGAYQMLEEVTVWPELSDKWHNVEETGNVY